MRNYQVISIFLIGDSDSAGNIGSVWIDSATGSFAGCCHRRCIGEVCKDRGRQKQDLHWSRQVVHGKHSGEIMSSFCVYLAKLALILSYNYSWHFFNMFKRACTNFNFGFCPHLFFYVLFYFWNIAENVHFY